ncbi:MAG: hypothetical protein A3C43_08480 [Candidatus Schekmanbacteria bacterium RIFCSPHIGHO2_02_FULL_38_11]|uniref:Peptidase M20 domain-containing protein 2 n=1 Tax=Candidatus Schekmanbacteria bacterium RIFCSPLOWO2_12_FULL_38_15 TaxID=1817883 RepID=A0A1F7SEB3_9BACT|nr:MAG: hypothetical protein A3C43_08480 [Candidatus Schekmanbacteria bacterium RIFCSPHIGHO2_02_FULL_38_11]OGL52105.1 MAG: hypothetical protein A3G31_06710 [Candidatus Schekmanbacteria bacterium RIFCSPLOWO2_12_FULL_38_15]
METQKIKNEIIAAVDAIKKELIILSHNIHSNPELGFNEYKACKWLTDFLKENGFDIKISVASMETAFVAQFPREAKNKPCIAFFAEYDALPGIGHGCGHNIIGPASCGAAAALARVLKSDFGRILVVGTPAEEGGGGKLSLIKAGVFNGVDTAMMIHPDIKTKARANFLANVQMRFKFYGQSAHAAASPFLGRNALDAVILTFNNINALRQQLPSDVRIHGIITDGGERPNIIPAFASCWFYVRTKDKDYLETLIEKVKVCAQAGATATGCRIEIEMGENRYYPMKHNKALENLFRESLEFLNIKESLQEERGTGSSDIGNVSHILPTIHPNIKICNDAPPTHSKEFAQAAISSQGDEGLIAGAKALALTALDLFLNPEKLEEVKREFAKL